MRSPPRPLSRTCSLAAAWNIQPCRAVPGWHHLDHPDRFWDIVLGTGYRATIDALSQEQRDIVRERLLSRLRSEGITSVRTDVVFSTAQRPH